MGSIIQSTPLIKTLKAKYPTCRIIYISSKENLQILKQIPGIDDIICIDDRSMLGLSVSIFSFIRKLQIAKIEVFIDLEVYSNFSTLMTIFSMAKNRMGFYINSMHYRLGNYTHMMYYNTRNSISDTYLQFARLLNCESISHELVNLDSNITGLKLSDNLLLDLVHEKYILINPNASDLRIERRWLDRNFIQLIQLINSKFSSYKIILVGSPGEASYVAGILDGTGISQNIFSMAGKTNIPELIALIKNAYLFITNDSGPMHIAFSTRTRTIALFGPCSPNQYTYNKNCYVIYENLYCSPCVHEFVSPPCKGNNYCMKAILVGTVFEKVTAALEQVDGHEDWKQKDMLFKINDFTIGTLNRKNKI